MAMVKNWMMVGYLEISFNWALMARCVAKPWKVKVPEGPNMHDVTLYLADVQVISRFSFLVMQLHALGPFQQGN